MVNETQRQRNLKRLNGFFSVLIGVLIFLGVLGVYLAYDAGFEAGYDLGVYDGEYGCEMECRGQIQDLRVEFICETRGYDGVKYVPETDEHFCIKQVAPGQVLFAEVETVVEEAMQDVELVNWNFGASGAVASNDESCAVNYGGGQ